MGKCIMLANKLMLKGWTAERIWRRLGSKLWQPFRDEAWPSVEALKEWMLRVQDEVSEDSPITACIYGITHSERN